MMLRVPPLPAMLIAGLAVSVIPAPAQRVGSLADSAQQSSASSGSVVEEIIARVNDQAISKSDYERAEQELEQEARQQSWTEQQVMEQRHDLLRSLIDRQLLLSQGKQLGISGETEVVKRLDEIRKQNHLESMDDLQKAVESQGISYEDFKEQIREGVITQQVIGQQVGSRIQVAPSELETYYKSHLQEFQRPESVKLDEILITTPNPDDAAQVATAEKKADDIESRLKAGGDFAAIAKAESEGPTAKEGGRLGEYKRGDLPKVMEDATFNLQPGQFTQPIRTRQGWLILQVTAHEKAGVAPLDEVQNQIQEEVGMSKMEPALRQYLTTLRDQAYIDIRPGYVDSGASPNELKFIQSAYVPPQPKKKKHVVRARYNGRPGRGRNAGKVQAAAGAPAEVPALDKVNASRGKNQVASIGTQKPGKKEKIRYGQAPRETLPAGDTREVDAGANAPPPQQQVAINQSGISPSVAAAVAAPSNTADTTEKKKSRYSDRLKEPKQKREQQKKQEWAATHHQKFIPPKETSEEKSQDQRQNAALGLKGDTTKVKKVNPAKSGPKRRLSDKKKNEDQQQQSNPQNAAPAPAPTGTPASAPAQPQQ